MGESEDYDFVNGSTNQPGGSNPYPSLSPFASQREGMTSTRTDLSTSFEEIGHDDIEDIDKSEAGKESPTISSLASSSSKNVSIIEDASETEVSGDDEESSTAVNRNLRKQSEMQLEEEPVVAPEQPPLPDSPAYTPRGLNDSLVSSGSLQSLRGRGRGRLRMPQPPKMTDLGESRKTFVKSPTDAVPPRTNHPFQYSDPEPKAEPALIENLEIAAPSPPQRATVESDFSEDDADDERNNSREESPALEERPETPVRDQREEERNHGGEATNLQVPNEEFFNYEEIIRDLREELETTRTEFALQQGSQVDELNFLKEEIQRLMKRNTELGEKKEEISQNYEKLREGYDQVFQQFEQASAALQESENKNSVLTRRRQEERREFQKNLKTITEEKSELEAQIDGLQEEYEALQRTSEESLGTVAELKNLIRKKDAEVDNYHNDMEKYVKNIESEKNEQTAQRKKCERRIEELENENAQWKKARTNANRQVLYFLRSAADAQRLADEQCSKLNEDLKWKQGDCDSLKIQLQQANTKIEVQETEIRRLAQAEEDLHKNIRNELDEKEKLLMEKLQAESNVNDYRELNENQKAQLAQQSVRRKSMEELLNQEKQKRAQQAKEHEEKMERLEKLEEENNCAICFDPFNEQDHFQIALKCGHKFGNTCIKASFSRRQCCPTCNKQARESDFIRLY